MASAAKTAYYTQMAEVAARQVTGSREQWTAFLTTAARLYKYPYNEQLMIYKQRPDATACAEYDLWNETMRRYVRRGSKGIALIDNTGSRPNLRYVFDVSDTGTRKNSRPVNLWAMKDEYVPAVQEALESAYGVEAGAGLDEQIEKIASRLASEYWDDNKEAILGIVDDSFLYGYDEFNVEVSFRRAAETSIRYMLYSRCVEDPESYFEPEDFMAIDSVSSGERKRKRPNRAACSPGFGPRKRFNEFSGKVLGKSAREGESPVGKGKAARRDPEYIETRGTLMEEAGTTPQA